MAAQRTLRTLFRVFAVVLDRARFVSEAGIYFYMADWDSSGDPDPHLEVCPDDTWVWRGLGMSEVADDCSGAVISLWIIQSAV